MTDFVAAAKSAAVLGSAAAAIQRDVSAAPETSAATTNESSAPTFTSANVFWIVVPQRTPAMFAADSATIATDAMHGMPQALDAAGTPSNPSTSSPKKTASAASPLGIAAIKYSQPKTNAAASP
jgi:hypothetical protein